MDFWIDYIIFIVICCIIISIGIPLLICLPILLFRKIKKSLSSKKSLDKFLHEETASKTESITITQEQKELPKRALPKSTLEQKEFPCSPSRPQSAITDGDDDPYRWDTGKVGERYAREMLNFLTGYKRFLSNCYIPKPDGTFSEIDLILLHESGIYVLESKSYSGWIYGNEEEQQWRQLLPGGRQTYFFNPILQNQSHLRWLKNFLGNNFPYYSYIYSYIVFSDRCELKEIVLTSGNHCVVNRRSLVRKIRRNAELVGSKLTPRMIDFLYHKLYPFTQFTKEQKAAHIETVRKKRLDALLLNRKCPRCGGELVVRTAKKGKRVGKQFLGCSNYPKCRFIENID